MSRLFNAEQEQARRLVERNIFLCQTALVSHILRSAAIPGFTWDDVLNLYDVDAIDRYLDQCKPPDEWHELPFGEREALAMEHGFVPEPQEIFEWWVVSPYLERRLFDLGEPILSNYYGTWWGRTCSGQAIYLDAVIARVLEGEEP